MKSCLHCDDTVDQKHWRIQGACPPPDNFFYSAKKQITLWQTGQLLRLCKCKKAWPLTRGSAHEPCSAPRFPLSVRAHHVAPKLWLSVNTNLKKRRIWVALDASASRNLRAGGILFLDVSVREWVWVSEPLRPENLANTMSHKTMKGFLPSFGHRCIWVHRCDDWISRSHQAEALGYYRPQPVEFHLVYTC